MEEADLINRMKAQAKRLIDSNQTGAAIDLLQAVATLNTIALVDSVEDSEGGQSDGSL